MKKTFTRIFILLFTLFASSGLHAQCPTGTTGAELNWDVIDFLPSNNTRYTTYYPSAAFPYTQKFAIGTRTVTMTMAPAANITLNGENGTNTAHAGTPVAAGEDVQFTTTTAAATNITMAFDINVANVQFSLFDLDAGQRATITAVNAAAVAQTIVVTKANGGSATTITGSTTTTAIATGPATNYANTDNNGSINVTIAGPVRQIIVSFSGAAGDVWLSDIDACVTGSFPNNYHNISRPFTGQPQYVLTVVNNNIYYVDPATGRGYFLFNEPAHNRLNSMAYDPYERVVYYTFSLTGGTNPQNDKVLRKYDVDTKTISIVSNNVNNLGIPTYESGVESGAATFYNGSLYLGIEGYTGTSGGGSYAASRKSTIWKIDFDAAGVPVGQAAQVWGVTADDGVNSQNIHDWSDFGISNGMLYDFDGSQSGDIDYYHFNMMTGTNVNFVPTDGVIPRQVSIGWDEKLYNVDATLGQYNGTTATGPQTTIFSPLGPVIPTGSAASWGDAAGPYRPFLDFGDAPATYDPVALSPACHDTLTPNLAGRRTKMILGPNEDVEWLKKGFTTVEDNFEDGLAMVRIFDPTLGTYTARVTVLNNTGINAKVGGWLDFNGNGVFDAAEGITPVTVASSTLPQLVNLVWPSTMSTLPLGSFTYLRLRITAASYTMTASTPTGYYDMGEVEDYRVLVDDTPLPVNLISFDAKTINNSAVDLNWTASEESGMIGYEIQRGQDNNWEVLATVTAKQDGGVEQYSFRDNAPLKGNTQYRLRLLDGVQAEKYSETRTVILKSMLGNIVIAPNPAVKDIHVAINNEDRSGTAQIRIIGITGNILYSQSKKIQAGMNTVTIPVEGNWQSGTYIVQVSTDSELISKKVIVRK